jgi:hypothetical protein
MRLKKLVGAVYTSTTFGTFPGLSIGTFLLSVDMSTANYATRYRNMDEAGDSPA